jgi:hypothetical protein
LLLSFSLPLMPSEGELKQCLGYRPDWPVLFPVSLTA